MSSGAGSLKRAQQGALEDVLNDSVRTRQADRRATQDKKQAADARFANIEANPFYQIIGDTALSPEQQRKAIHTAWTFNGTKEEMRERAKQFEQFKEYMQQVREDMATEIIKLTDTEAFSELQKVYDDLNSGLIDFNDQMTPLTSIIDALYKLRTRGDGMILTAFKEIQEDRKREAALTEAFNAKSLEDTTIKNDLDRLDNEILALSEKKSLWGLGGVKESARIEIKQKEAVILEKQARQEAVKAEMAQIEKDRTETNTKLGDLAFAKDKLRELLDISSSEHIERQKRLVNSALNFVSTTKERVGAVRTHLDHMGDRVQNLADANQNMTRVYAIMSEGLRDAEKSNTDILDGLKAPEGVEEDLISKTTRDDKRQEIQSHLKTLNNSAGDTVKTYADLTTQTIRIKTMAEANDSQVTRVKAMHSEGVASVADRLSTVLQSVSAAALGEASATAKDTMEAMRQFTDKVAQQESIRTAMGANEANVDLAKAIENVAAYGEVLQETTEISREAVAEMRENLAELQRAATGVQADIRKNVSVHADAAKGGQPQTAEAQTTAKKPMFGIGG